MLEMDAPAQARAKGKMLSDALSKLPQVVEIRGRGLLLGVELQSGIEAKTAQSMLLDRGLVTNAVTASALRLAPPITVLDSEIATAVELITSVLAEIASKS
jgi:acetylornithine/succinyldiaminopimelate/putrescine aminotransferase